MNTSNFNETWVQFTGELDARQQRLYSEIEAAWNDLNSILQKQVDKMSNEDWRNPQAGILSSILDFTKAKGSGFLFEPLLSLKKAHPQERALSAIDKYQSDIEDIVRLLPNSISVSRKELKSCLNFKGEPFRHLLIYLRRQPFSLSIRALVRQTLLEHSVQRARWDGQMLLLFWRATLSLMIPWQFMCSDALKALGGDPLNQQASAKDRDKWFRMISDLRKNSARNLAAFSRWRQSLPGCLASALVPGDRRLSDQRRDRARDQWQNCFRYWSSQQRMVVAQLELESASTQLLESAVRIARESLTSVDEEHAQILSELDNVDKWLTNWSANDANDPFPPPEAHLISSEDRAFEWRRRLEAAGRMALPASIETVNLRRALPSRRMDKRSIAAENYFVKSLDDIGRGKAVIGFAEAEEGHRAIIREIERAREVAAYSFEVAKSESENEESQQIVKDGITNALSLLAYQKKTITDYKPVVERRLTEALVSTFLQFHVRMEEGRLGIFTFLARQKGSRAVRSGTGTILYKIKAGTHWLSDQISQFNKFVLVRLGWLPPSTVAVEPVTRYEYLGEILNLKSGPRELPAIYKRLFRLDPIEDQRFLVGREAEMAAATEARSLWEEGRSVAILLAGARGSGKTSFLNCARNAVFNDLPSVSGQFSQRVTTALSMRSFLSSLLQIDVSDLDRQLNSGKRLIVLEEAERTFLRHIGGFHGLHTLLNIISATSRHTLWILSLNEVALRYLTQVVSMEEYFPYRINAMAVAPPHLRNAVLLRHNLSGLRLHFAEPPSTVSGDRKVRRLLGGEKDSEEIYFESLYRQTEGIFRSAFELWQESVDRVEGGVLYMLNPPNPSYNGMISRFTIEDSFLLQAILQHGSLTSDEISVIFNLPLERSDRRLEKLIAWEIIEPDPNNPGFRVRPEAGRLVREALYRQNLL